MMYGNIDMGCQYAEWEDVEKIGDDAVGSNSSSSSYYNGISAGRGDEDDSEFLEKAFGAKPIQ
jgi:hypothetical protein